MLPADEIRLDVCWTFALGMSMVDVLRGAFFQAQYTLLALRSGDDSKISLGMGAELAMGAIDNRRARARTERIFSLAVELAQKTANHRALAFATSMRGVVAWLGGEWQDCYDRSITAGEIYREKCSGVLWELTTANAFALSSLVFLGRWREHAEALPALTQQAEERGDRYGAVSLPLLGYAYIDHLALDEPESANEVITKALSAWRDEQFHLQHCDALFGRIEILLYEGRAIRALHLMEQEYPRLKRSNLLQISFNKIFLTALRGRTALAAAISREHPQGRKNTLINHASRDAGFLSTQKVMWSQALGRLLEAGIRSALGRRGDAARLLLRAKDLFEETGMRHYVAATKNRLVQLHSRDSGGAIEPSLNDRWILEQKVRNPTRILDMLAPGIWE